MGFNGGGGAEPDNITLETNVGGDLAIKDEGVDTAQIKDDAVTTAKILDANVTFAKLGSDLFKMDFLETLDFSSSTSETTASLTVYDKYILMFDKMIGSASGFISLHFNGVTGTSYTQHKAEGAVVAYASGLSNIDIGQTSTQIAFDAIVQIGGKTPAVGSGKLGVGSMGTSSNYTGFGGTWAGGNNVQISTITVSAPTATNGKVHVFGVKYT